MGLRAASARISVRGGHWPGPAHLPRDWLRGRRPGLIFLRRGPRQAAPAAAPGGAGGARRPGRPGGSPRSPQVLASPRLRPLRLAARLPPRGGAGHSAQTLSPGGLDKGGRTPPGTHLPAGAPGRSSPRVPAQTPPTPGPLSLAPGGPPEDCGLQPAGRFPSQRPLCPCCGRPRPWTLGTAWPFLPVAGQSHFFLCPQIPIW